MDEHLSEPSGAGGCGVTATRDPWLGMFQCIYVTAATLKAVSNILPVYFTYLLTCCRVQQLYHTIRPWSSVGVRAITLYLIFHFSDMFCSQWYTSFSSLDKGRHSWPKTNSLRVNLTVNRLLCLLWQLPEINYARLVYYWAWTTYDLLSAMWPLVPPDELPYFWRAKSTTWAITTTNNTLVTWKMTWPTVWAAT